VTQSKEASELSARNYGFEILQRIQKRRLIGENYFEVQQGKIIIFRKVLERRRDGNKSFGLIANTQCPGRQDGYY